MHRLRRFRPDLLALALLTLLPLVWFGPVLFTGKTLLPYDNLYRFEPWRSLQTEIAPHNELLSDLVLENAVWKLHVRRTLQQREIPLWNPQLFTGAPFFAAGQASAAYPLSALFYLLPIEVAFGWFTAIQLAVAGANAYLLGRVLKLRPAAALFSGVAFQFSGFMVVSVVFTMVIAAASWLPLLLATIERMVQKQEEKGVAGFRPIPYVVVGIGIVGLVVLAGHPEFLYYTLLVAGIYTIARLLVAWRRLRGTGGHHTAQTPNADHPRRATTDRRVLQALAGIAAWILLIPILGLAAGAVQLLPLYELVQQNFREGSASYRQVIDWAWPDRHVLTFLLPDIFGNPSHHRWFDLWELRWQPATVNWLGESRNTIFWGIKNYVEGGNYVGVSTWLLAALAVCAPLTRMVFRSGDKQSDSSYAANLQLRVPTLIFASLALVSLLYAFGTPLYALLFYGLPGWDQLHSPFRWVFPFTLAMALLGGIGLEQALSFRSKCQRTSLRPNRTTPHPVHVVNRPSRTLGIHRRTGRLTGRRFQFLHSLTLREPGAAGRGSIRSGSGCVRRRIHVLGIPERRHYPLRRLCPCEWASPLATHKNGSQPGRKRRENRRRAPNFSKRCAPCHLASLFLRRPVST